MVRPLPTAAPKERPWPRVLPVAPDQPLRWLVLGFRDLCHRPGLSLAHGLLATVLGWAITAWAHERFWLLASLTSGFMVLAPVLATSLYAMSRAIEQGRPVNLALLWQTWAQWPARRQRPGDGALIRFGLLLGLAAAGWVLTSSAFIHLMAPVPIRTPMDFARHIVASPSHQLFELWLLLGGLLAAPVFASSVVSMPLLLDRQVGVLEAVLTSWRVVLAQPITLALWAFLLMGFSALGLFSAFLGLILVVPMLGHASWHAYRDLVDASDCPERLTEGAS